MIAWIIILRNTFFKQKIINNFTRKVSLLKRFLMQWIYLLYLDPILLLDMRQYYPKNNNKYLSHQYQATWARKKGFSKISNKTGRVNEIWTHLLERSGIFGIWRFIFVLIIPAVLGTLLNSKWFENLGFSKNTVVEKLRIFLIWNDKLCTL